MSEAYSWEVTIRVWKEGDPRELVALDEWAIPQTPVAPTDRDRDALRTLARGVFEKVKLLIADRAAKAMRIASRASTRAQ